MDDLFLKALKCEKTPYSPVWLMRQAGRYLPEYRALKEKYTFLELCQNPDLATDITLMPLKRFDLDAAILFADILLILNTVGQEISFGKSMGPQIKTLQEVDKIQIKPVEDILSYIPKTIKNLKSELQVPLIGFCGAPFTLTTYVIEGKSSKDFEKVHSWIKNHPKKMHQLLSILTDQTIKYLKMQISAGVDALQIFDSWAGNFSNEILAEFSYPYLNQIVQELKAFNIPIILFAKGSSRNFKHYLKMDPQAIGIDFEGDLLKIKDSIPKNVAIQGNIDPDLLFEPLAKIEREVKRLTVGMKDRPGYIMNLGHGIKPNTPIEAVKCLIQTTHELQYSAQESLV